MGYGDFESIHKPGAKRLSLTAQLSPSPWQQRQRAWEILDTSLPPNLNAWLENVHHLAGGWQSVSSFDALADEGAALVVHDQDVCHPDNTKAMVRQLKNEGLTVILAVACGEEGVDATKNLDLEADGLLAVTAPCRSLFTALKAAFEAWPSLREVCELSLCSASVLASGDVSAIRSAMRTVRCDYWSASVERSGVPALNCEYLALRAKTLGHEAFARFMGAVGESPDKKKAKAMETAFSIWLEMSGLAPGSYRSYDVRQHWEKALREHVPFIRVSDIVSGMADQRWPGWREAAREGGVPKDLLAILGTA